LAIVAPPFYKYLIVSHAESPLWQMDLHLNETGLQKYTIRAIDDGLNNKHFSVKNQIKLLR